MDQSDNITVQSAIDFYIGCINAELGWLEKFRDGSPRDRRGSMDIQQHENKLRYFEWTLKQLQRSVRA